VVRLGKYNHTVDSGITLLVPFIDAIIIVDLREKVMNVQPQKVITKDNVSVIVDAVIYYKVVDPVKAEFEIEDFDYAATTLAQTNLRNLIGDTSLDETLTARDSINTSLRQVLDESTNAWGVKVTKVELQKIDPPQDITDSMSQQMKAEREKRARILEPMPKPNLSPWWPKPPKLHFLIGHKNYVNWKLPKKFLVVPRLNLSYLPMVNWLVFSISTVGPKSCR